MVDNDLKISLFPNITPGKLPGNGAVPVDVGKASPDSREGTNQIDEAVTNLTKHISTILFQEIVRRASWKL